MTVTATDARVPGAGDSPTAAREGKAALHLRPLVAEGRRSQTVLLSSALCPAQAHSDYLQPAVALIYQRHAVDSGSGTFVVRLSLHNRSQHIAHEPFLCLPLLGLDLSPAPGLGMQDVSSIRRLRRFSPAPGTVLRPGASMHCCNISLLFTAQSGGRVEYDAGSWHPIESLPDLRLTCVAGAGNYPSERLPLVVLASSLRSFISDLVSSGEIPPFDKPE